MLVWELARSAKTNLITHLQSLDAYLHESWLRLQRCYVFQHILHLNSQETNVVVPERSAQIWTARNLRNIAASPRLSEFSSRWVRTVSASPVIVPETRQSSPCRFLRTNCPDQRSAPPHKLFHYTATYASGKCSEVRTHTRTHLVQHLVGTCGETINTHRPLCLLKILWKIPTSSLTLALLSYNITSYPYT